MEVTFRMPTQTKKGIIDPAKFFEIRMVITSACNKLFMVLSAQEQLAQLLQFVNCHVLATAFESAFLEFDLRRVSGHFGMPRIVDDQIATFDHSWLVPACAPDWVVDVSPFNGMITPSIVYVGEPPWAGLYRTSEEKELLSNDNQKKAVTAIVAMLKGLK